MKLNFLSRFESGSTNKKIFRAAVIVGGLALVAKAVGSVKELVVAQSFGRNDTLDAFLIAFLLPSFVVSLSMGALGSAMVPVLVETRQKLGLAGTQELLSSVVLLSTLALIAIAALLGFLAPYYLPWIGHGFSGAKLQLTRELLYVLLPFVLFSGIALLLASCLNAGELFALPSVVPVTTPLVAIAFIVFAAPKWGVFSLAGGVVAGSILEAGFLLYILRRHGMQFDLKWNRIDPGARSVLRQCAPMLAGAFLMGSTSVVDQSMAAMLAGGSVAALSYANKITGAFLAIGATALGTAAFPYFSRMVADNDWQGCRHTLKRYTLLVASATVPFTLLLMVFSRPLVKLLFQRGAFTSADAEVVSEVQICYALQIPFYVCGLLFVRFLSAARYNRVVMYISGINLILDIVLNIVLMRLWGVAGIALSTSIVYLSSFLMVALCSIRLLSRQSPSALAAAPPDHDLR